MPARILRLSRRLRLFCLLFRFLLTHESTRQFGNVDEQVELVARQLQDVRQLSGGFDAIGFSQGSYYTQKQNGLIVLTFIPIC